MYDVCGVRIISTVSDFTNNLDLERDQQVQVKVQGQVCRENGQ